MPLLTYSEARPWAKAIRDAVLTRKMPPWFADPLFGHFSNDPSLKKTEIDTIADWANTGAPEGNPQDRPPPVTWPEGWNIGRPDAVFEMPLPFPIPANGDVAYQYVIIPTHLKEDRWVQRIEVRPSARDVVHHAVAYIREPGSGWLRDRPMGVPFALHTFTKSDILMVYTPGSNVESLPDGMAKKIPAGSDIVLQMHYTSKGKPRADQTRIGVIFARTQPSKAVYTLQLNNDRFAIPPGDPDCRVTVSGTLPNDALLLSLFPHMHLRGKGFEYMMVEPNGRATMLLKVNDYDFNWQLTYKLGPPLALKAGTRLTAYGYYDNSANNPRNPDPTAEVHYGEQSWEEMMIGFFDVAIDAHLSKAQFFIRGARR